MKTIYRIKEHTLRNGDIKYTVQCRPKNFFSHYVINLGIWIGGISEWDSLSDAKNHVKQRQDKEVIKTTILPA